jgi:hypothetical protein
MNVEIQIHKFSASAIYGGEQPNSRFSRSYPVDRRRLRWQCREELPLLPSSTIVQSTFTHEDKASGP